MSLFNEILSQLAALRLEVAEVRRELRGILTHSHHHWCPKMNTTKEVEDEIEELIHRSNQPEWLKY
eukprot:COSAG04_NODE_64_length_29689_cov_158.096992_31_plen_66_part_00